MRHDNLMRTIDGLIKKGLIKGPAKPRVKRSRGYAHIFSGERGLTDALTLVGKVSPGSQLKVAARWNELKSVEAQPVAVAELETRIEAPVPHRVTEIVDHFAMEGETLTMSSLTIAELTDKDHFHVMRDVRSMLEDLGGAIESKFGGYYKAANGKQNPCFNLPRREVDILLTGYSVPLRAKVIDRWRVLEAQAAKPVANLNDPASLRGLLLGYTEQVLQLEHKIEVDKPKVEFFDNFANKEELDTVEVLAKSLGTGRNRLFSYMRSHNILIGGTGDNKNMPYQKYIDSGRLKVKWNNYTVPETGEVKVRPSPLFTGKGAIWIREFIEENGRAGL